MTTSEPAAGLASPDTRITNWSRNVVFTPARFHHPTSVPELQQVVAGAERARALGTGHSFNRIADTTGDLVSLREMPSVIEVDAEAMTVRVSSATRYGELGAVLQAAGLALPNTGSLPHISVAGACATGTHGSGVTNRALATGVRAQTLVTGSGDLVTMSREANGGDFDGSVLALGRLGIVTELTLDVVPTFDIEQSVVLGVSDDAVAEHVEAMLRSAYSVSIFTVFEPDANRLWVKERTARSHLDDPTPRWDGSQAWGGQVADVAQHPVVGMDAQHATEQLGVAGPWNERLPHFRLAFTPSAGEELQSEYLLPIAKAGEGWRGLCALRSRLTPLLLAGEVRAIAPDRMWLGTTGGQLSVAFHFTWVDDLERVLPVLAEVEAVLMPLGARPHWGKVFAVPDEQVQALYPRMHDIRRLVEAHDPAGVFGNDLVDGWLGL